MANKHQYDMSNRICPRCGMYKWRNRSMCSICQRKENAKNKRKPTGFVGVCTCEIFEADKTGLQCRRCFKPNAKDLSL